jgi:hypothetical protein
MRKQIPISTRELPFKTYDVQDIDSISLASGYLNLHIPIVSHPQRGAIPRAYQLGYNDKNWFVNERCTNNQTQPCALRWEYRGSGVRVINTGWAEYGYGPLFHKIASPTIFTAYTADGSSHWFDATRAVASNLWMARKYGPVPLSRRTAERLAAWLKRTMAAFTNTATYLFVGEDANGNKKIMKMTPHHILSPATRWEVHFP